MGLVAFSWSLAARNRKPCAIRCDSEWRQYYAQHGRAVGRRGAAGRFVREYDASARWEASALEAILPCPARHKSGSQRWRTGAV